MVTWIGALTAIFAASIAVAQNDIKRILAYSTVSQLGYMMLGLGVGGVAVGMFHLITHAFFKALLFLGSGSVIHGCHEEQDVRKMGGLKKFMPVTFATYAIGMLALAGFPLFFSGFWSKDEILHSAHGWPVSHIPFYLGCAGALLTAFYMTRQVALVFFGQYRRRRVVETAADPRMQHLTASISRLLTKLRPTAAPHESPAVMTVPLVILAVFAILLGFVGTPAWPWFDGFLKGEPAGFNFSRLTEGGTLGLMLASAVIVFTGLGLGWWLYGRRLRKTAEEPDVLQVAQPVVFRLLENKYFVDEIYEATVIRFNAWAARFCDFLDRWIWGGVVLLVTWVTLGLSRLYRFTDEFVVDLGFDTGCETLREGGGEIVEMAQRPGANLSPRHRRGAGGAGSFPDLGAQIMNLPWLTILILVPLFGGIIVAGLGAEQKRLARGLALVFSLVGLTGALCLWKHFNAASGDLQFVEKHDWVKSLGIQYFLGVDGLGLLMVMLTAIVAPHSGPEVFDRAVVAHGVTRDRTPTLLRAGVVAAGGLVRHVHRAEFLPLVPVLGTGAHPGVLPHQTLGRTEARPGGDAVFHLHHGRQRDVAVELPGHPAGDGQF